MAQVATGQEAGTAPFEARDVVRYPRGPWRALVARFEVWQGAPKVDVRCYTTSARGALPTGNGLRIDIADLPTLRACVDALEAEARGLGLLHDDQPARAPAEVRA